MREKVAEVTEGVVEHKTVIRAVLVQDEEHN